MRHPSYGLDIMVPGGQIVTEVLLEFVRFRVVCWLVLEGPDCLVPHCPPPVTVQGILNSS